MEQPGLGKKIAQLRKDQNLSQEELTERCHVSVRTIQRIESGEVMPRSSTIRILLAALDYDFKDLKSITEEEAPGTLAFLFLTRELTPSRLSMVLQLSWITGVVYFVSGILEGVLDMALYQGDSLSDTGNLFYAFIKVLAAGSYFFFARGFLALGQVFNNYLLRVSTYLLIGIFTFIELGDVVLLYLDADEGTTAFIKVGESLTVGAAGIIFGIALIRLQDGMGRLSGYAGVLEMIIGVSFASVIFFLVGFVVMIPAIILEVVLVYKGYVYVEEELVS